MTLKRVSTKAKGTKGENLAARFLKKRGFKIITQNYRTPFGELDIVAEDNGRLVFVEVRTLRAEARHSPEETVNFKKQQKISRLALAYIQEKGLEDRLARFDVIAIEASRPQPTIRHIPDAFDIWEP